MRKIFLVAMAALTAFSFTSCSDDDPTLRWSYGTVQEKVSGENLKIRKDAGAYLTVDGPTGSLKEGDRVIVTYEVLGDFTEGGNNTVKLWHIYNVLTKDVRLQSELGLDEAEEVKLGNDGIVDLAAWYGGEYLNIEFTMLFGVGQTRPHFINLVADDVEFDGETMTVTLRHNAYGDVPESTHRLRYVDGLVSFRLSDLFDGLEIAEADYPKVTLKWEKYKSMSSNETETKTLELKKFEPWKMEQAAEKADADRVDATTMTAE